MSIPYRWVIVFLGGLMGCVAIGAMFSLAVFLEPMSAETGWSRAGISTAMTLDFLIMGVAGFLWGAAATAGARARWRSSAPSSSGSASSSPAAPPRP